MLPVPMNPTRIIFSLFDDKLARKTNLVEPTNELREAHLAHSHLDFYALGAV
jgi:hypothetical protein